MPNPAATPQFRLRAVCDICNVSERRLRSWIDRRQITLEADADRAEGETAHRRFSVFDLVKIATASRLVDYGTPVTEANRLAQEILADRLELLKRYRNPPPGAVFAGLRTRAVLVWCQPESSAPDGYRWHWAQYSKARAKGKDVIVRVNLGKMAEALTAGIATYEQQKSEDKND